MNAGEIMVRPVVTIRRDASLEQAARLLLDHRFGCLPVVDDAGRLCGIVTEADFFARERRVPFSTLLLPQVFNEWIPPRGIERIYQAARSTTVGEIMRDDLVTASEATSIDEVVERMLRHDVKHIPVTRDGLPVGIVSRHDLLRLMADAKAGAAAAGGEAGGT